MISKMRNTFSLIELISVIAIMVIIMAITLPAFLTMTKGQAVELAAREIGSKLKAVRSYAITNRVRTALVFPTNQAFNAGMADRYAYKSYRACKLDLNNNITAWVSDEKWEFLPTGTIIQDIIDSTTFTVPSDNIYTPIFSKSTGADTSLNPDNKVFSSSNITFQSVTFKPTGDSIGSVTPIRVFVGEGANNTDPAKITIHNQANSAVITVNTFTGRVSYGNQ